jgi:hypothetical protein
MHNGRVKNPLFSPKSVAFACMNFGYPPFSACFACRGKTCMHNGRTQQQGRFGGYDIPRLQHAAARKRGAQRLYCRKWRRSKRLLLLVVLDVSVVSGVVCRSFFVVGQGQRGNLPPARRLLAPLLEVRSDPVGAVGTQVHALQALEPRHLSRDRWTVDARR